MNNIKNHWSNFTYYEPIASVMSRNRFQLLLRYPNFVDNDDLEVDKTKRLWKIQSFFKHLPQNCLKLYPEQHQAIDKMSTANKGKRGPRQYTVELPLLGQAIIGTQALLGQSVSEQNISH